MGQTKSIAQILMGFVASLNSLMETTSQKLREIWNRKREVEQTASEKRKNIEESRQKLLEEIKKRSEHDVEKVRGFHLYEPLTELDEEKRMEIVEEKNEPIKELGARYATNEPFEELCRLNRLWVKQKYYLHSYVTGSQLGCLVLGLLMDFGIAVAFIGSSGKDRQLGIFLLMITIFVLLAAIIFPSLWKSGKLKTQRGFDENKERAISIINEWAERESEEINRRAQRELEAVNSWENEQLTALNEEENNAYQAFKDTYEIWLRGLKETCEDFLRRYPLEVAPWTTSAWREWNPVNQPMQYLRLGVLQRVISFPSLQMPVPASLPAIMEFPSKRGLIILTNPQNRQQAVQMVQNLLFRLLALIPPGKLRFTFIDPVGLGSSAASLLDLKEYDETEEDSLVTSRAWTEPDHIRKQLSSIREYIATVVQERLRDKYNSIEEYNEEAGEIAVPYRFLIIYDFPANFDDISAQILLSIAQSGPRCGVYPIVIVDTSRKLPYEFKLEELTKELEAIDATGGVMKWMTPGAEDWVLVPDALPDVDLQAKFIQRWGSLAREGMKVEVPFRKMLENIGLVEGKWWTGSCAEELEIPLGPISARKIQKFIVGRGTLNHALIVGRTGSGKSNLMHVLITAGALKYQPDELVMFLIDLKTVEFVIYRELPNAKAVAVDSDREFALSVLEGIDREMLRRMEMFREIGANDLAEYRQRSGEKLPRVLLIIDEFQVLFERDDKVAQESARILDRLVRQGRAFGIHVILGSQSLAGHMLPRGTLDQMAVRIALQCSEADSRLVLADDNPAARRLSRPGQAIYNSTNGLIEGNTEFQVALFSDEDREVYLQRIRELAAARGYKELPIVFEGNQPAQFEKCEPLLHRLTNPPKIQRAMEAWIGEPVSLQPPLSVKFSKRAGNHLGVISREEEEGIGVLLSAVVSLCAGYPKDGVRIYFADFSLPEEEWAEIPEIIAESFPHQIYVLDRRALLQTIQDLYNEMKECIKGERHFEKDTYLIIAGLQRVRDLRIPEDAGFRWREEQELGPSDMLGELLREAADLGLHILIWCDTYANLRRCLDRKAINEIGFRLAGIMNEQDSTDWLGEPDAAHLDKPHRMLFYNDEYPGVLQKIRPYVIRDKEWLRRIGDILRSRE